MEGVVSSLVRHLAIAKPLVYPTRTRIYIYIYIYIHIYMSVILRRVRKN